MYEAYTDTGVRRSSQSSRSRCATRQTGSFSLRTIWRIIFSYRIFF